MCKQFDLVPNERCKPQKLKDEERTSNSASMQGSQSSIDGFLPNPPAAFSHEGLISHIIELIVCDDQVCRSIILIEVIS